MTTAPTSADKARRLRQRSTDTERRFWLILRDRRLQGWKFRRQVPLGSYVVDFYCATARLVVELDGGQHAIQAAHDQGRTDWLISQGYAVVRFWNNDVFANTDGVLSELLRHLQARNPLTLSLSREGRGNAVASSLSSEVPVEPDMEDQPFFACSSTAPSSTYTKKECSSVPSPLAGEGQGEGVFDGQKKNNREHTS